MTDNFVDVVGFGLEKVHTGVISWLLDSANSSVPVKDRILLLQKLLPVGLKEDDVTTIEPVREYSFGRQRRIDLVVIIEARSGARHLVIECKADTDVDFEQLEKSRAAYLERNPNAHCSFFVLTLGASQFTYQHIADKIAALGYAALNIVDAVRIFSGLSIAGKSKIYDDWLKALGEEGQRCSNIEQTLQGMKDLTDEQRNEQLKRFGYRPGFPTFYIFYAKLREQLEKGPFCDWAIYTGGNNPVLNWQKGWFPKGVGDERLDLYWEFNWESFCLKAELGTEPDKEKGNEKVRQASRQKWDSLRDKIQSVCESSKIKGRSTKNRQGFWVTAYKWNFSFWKESVHDIAEKTNTILEELHPKLMELV